MRWLYFGARNRLSDKGCHPFYEFPDDPAKICSFSKSAKFSQNSWYIMGISYLKSAIFYSFSLYFHYCHVERSRDIS